MITAEELRCLLKYDPETGFFYWLKDMSQRVKAGDKAGSKCDGGYVVIRIRAKNYKAHRLAWLWVHGVFPEFEIDHRNTQRSDNRLDNLRIASNSQNSQNQRIRSDSKSGIKCVTKVTGYTDRWQSYITVNGKRRYLGMFATKELAHQAYCKVAIAEFGEFARVA